MDDRDFFDHLYQMWSKTTGANDRYWMPVSYEDRSGRHRIYAVAQDDSRKLVAEHLSERDADFVTAVHGALADLVRRLHSALDESDSADFDRDSRECRIAELELENLELRARVSALRDELSAAAADLGWRER